MIAIKNIEKLSEIVKEIKNIEEKMIELDSLAKCVLTSNLKLSIAIEDSNKKKKVLDEDGSLISDVSDYVSGSSSYWSIGPLMHGSVKEEKNTEIFKHEITDITLLKVMQVLIETYTEQRKSYIKELNALQQ